MFFNKSLAWIGIFFCAGAIFAAPIKINKSIKANPSLYLDSTQASPELAKHFENLLVATFYFAPMSGSNVDYRLLIKSEPDGAAIYSLSGKNVSSAKRFRIADPRECAKQMVDDVLEAVFGVPVLCQSKITFAAQNSSGIRNIFTCDIDGGQFTQISRFQSLCVEPCYFPDGKSIAYTRYTPDHTTDIIETKTTESGTRRLAGFRGLNTGVSISPNGKSMAMILSQDKQVDLYVKDIDSPNLVRLTRDESVEASPCWSPDGKKICFVSDVSGKPTLYTINRDGTKRQKLPLAGSDGYTPDWSSQNKIAYITRNADGFRLAILDMNNNENELVPNVSGSWESPSWAPDGRLIVCSKRESGVKSSLFVIDSRTGMTRQLFRSAGSFSSPNWSKGVAQ